MKSDADEYMLFAIENHQSNVLIPETEQKETTVDFISMCEDAYLRHAESVKVEKANTGFFNLLTLAILDKDGSELTMRVGEYSFPISSMGEDTRQRYVSFTVANYYGRIDDSYRYKVSNDRQAVTRHVKRNYEDSTLNDVPIGKFELQKIQELLLLGRPREELY